ncbi:hypothetical protein C9I28_17110 [Pseudoduganella armeniaca]|uniref:EpsG family protein n=2 Tax=Pseudoduganella armeniaca TaxID=2072590 RepID=A0A2R4CCF0_9BURK|nr:hypothetical protein C9I28_17110 [Pseudoduganella armeniaca]
MNSTTQPRLTTLTTFATMLVCVIAGGYAIFGERLISALYSGEIAFPVGDFFSAERPLQFYLLKANRIVANWGMLLLAGCCTMYALLYRLKHPASSLTLVDWSLWALFMAIGCAFILLNGYEGDWYRLGQILGWTGAPPFQHRVLFVWLAQLLRALLPDMPVLGAYLVTQIVALALALLAVRLFCTLFIRRDLAFTAQFLALAMWAPTVSYYTFYDIGIVAVYALALFCLFQRRFGAYLVIFALGTYNHENSLFLMAACLFAWFSRMPMRQLAALLAAQLALYILVRLSLFHTLPTHAAWQSGKLAQNVEMILHTPGRVMTSLAPLLLWYAAAAAGLRTAPVMLRRATIILPCLVLTSIVVGQLNEARLFNAFIPVTVALLCHQIQLRAGFAAARPANAANA